MAEEAKREAKLTLKFETAEAVKGMKDVERAGDKVAEQQKEIAAEAGKATKAIQDQSRAAEAAAKAIERYGAEAQGFSKKPTKREESAYRAAENRLKREEEQLEKDRASRARDEMRDRIANENRRFTNNLDEQQRAANARIAQQGRAQTEALNKQAAAMKAAEPKSPSAAEKSRLEKIDQVHEEARATAERMLEWRRRRADEDPFAFAARSQSELYERPRPANDGAAGGIMAMVAPLRIAFGMAAAAAVVLGTALKGVAEVTDMRNNRYVSRQAGEWSRIDNATFGVSRLTRYIGERQLGVTDRIRNSDFASQERSVREQSDLGLANLSRQVYSDFAQAAFARAHWSGATASPAGRFDQSTLHGAQAHREEQMRLGSRDAVADAQRDALASRGALAYEEQQLGRVTDRHEGAITYRRRASASVVHERIWGSDETYRAAANNLSEAVTAEKELEKQKAEQVKRTQAAAEAALNGEINLRRRNIDAMQSEMQIAQQRAELHRGDLSSFGALNPIQRSIAVSSAEFIQRHGYDNSTPEMRAAAGSAFGGYVSLQAQQSAERDPLFARARAAGFTNVGGTDSMAQMREQVLSLSDGIRATSVEVTSLLKSGMEEIMQKFGRQIIDTFRESTERAIADLRRNLSLAATANR